LTLFNIAVSSSAISFFSWMVAICNSHKVAPSY
jgi:hypothetical protein